MLKRNLISLSVASALFASSFVVSANTSQQEEGSDSVRSWGTWSQNYDTAAGGELNTAALAFASLQPSESGRNVLNEPGFESVGSDTIEGLCNAGEMCAITSFYAHNPEGKSADQFSTGTTGIKTMDNLSGGQVIVYDNDGTELYRHSRGNVAGQVYFEDIDRTMDLDGHSDHGFDGGEGSGSVGTGVWFETAGNYWNYGGGAWGTSSTEDGLWPLNGIGGFYVVGVTSSLDAVAGLANQVNLMYTGTSFNGVNVAINLDMSNHTWDADFVGKDNISNGRYQSTSFKVKNGTIEGVNLFASTGQLSKGVSGQVQASFYGDDANQIGGVVDIEKKGKGYTDAFVAVKGGLR